MADPTDPTDPSSGPRRGSDAVFVSVVVVVTLLVVIGGAFLLLRPRDSSNAPPPLVDPTTTRSQPSAPSSARPTPAGATKARALAVVRKSFRLTTTGEFAAACALESRAYLAFDAEHYSHGSCEAESRALAQTLASQGLTMTLKSIRVASYDGDRATVVSEAAVGPRVVTVNAYVRYRDGRWWITGADDSGDLGF